MTVIHGDCIEVMRGMDEASVDSIVTDPPYGLGFMGKAWDALPPGKEWARECLRVLKPGGHLLAFGGTRTWHRLAVSIEDAGFEMRDSIAWLYGSGFPKNRAALKPAFEPIVMARKTYKGSLASNEALHGTGALMIDASRIGGPAGRWPANVVLDELQADALDQQTGIQKDGVAVQRNGGGRAIGSGLIYSGSGAGSKASVPDIGYGGGGGASRFFYCAKAPKSERPIVSGVAHPTVKPLALMRYLVKLATPAGGTVLDPFAGSGSTLEAAKLEGFQSIGIEAEATYLPLINARLGEAA